jgi:GNAT superfamily N-acetyltransferase
MEDQMGEAKRRKDLGLPPREKTALSGSIGVVDEDEIGMFRVVHEEGEIHGFTKKSNDSISVTLVRPTGGKSHSYTYHSVTGKADQNDGEFDGDWLGYINVLRSPLSRIRSTVESVVCKENRLPTGTAELQTFVDSRMKEGKPWWNVRMKFGPEETTEKGSVCLPRLLAFFQQADQSLKEPPGVAIISNTAVAPHHQKQGYGTLLHIFLAQHLRDEGFQSLISDYVGMNTAGELAVWNRLQGLGMDIQKMEPMSHLCVPRFLHSIEVIDTGMYKILNTYLSTHFGERECTVGELGKIDFPQYEWDLTNPIMRA